MNKFIIHVILEILLLCLLVFNTINIAPSGLPIAFAALLVFLIVLLATTRFRRPLNRRNSDVIWIIAGISGVFIGLLYFISFFSGYDESYTSIFKNYITKSTWILTFLVVFITEIIRYILTIVDYRREKYDLVSKIIMFINYVLIDFIIVGRSYNLSTLSGIYDFFGLFVIQSVSKNLLLNYLSKNYGSSSCLWYRIIVELYIYFIPFIPRINLLIKAAVLFIFPYFVYFIVKKLTDKRRKQVSRNKNTIEKVSTLLFAMIFSIIVALVSCEFKYAMIAIGSESMTGTINKGDAIIYENLSPNDVELKKGDIIIFEKNDNLIVHRIHNVFKLGNEKCLYQTKGDNNEIVDNWLVSDEEIIGVVKGRVLWIAWPSVLLNEYFSK